MKGLLKIVLGGFVAFMVLAVAQEWSFFASAWFSPAEAAPAVTAEERHEAAEAVRRVLTLVRHYYAAGGDPRFADRMPVSDGIREELARDLDYLRRNHRVQDALLRRLEIVATDPIGPGRIEVRTREFWHVRFLSLVDGEETDPPLWQVVGGRYLAVRGNLGWRVESWDFDLDVQAPGDA